MEKLKKLKFIHFISLIIGLFLLARLPGLGYDISNSDSARWHRRSERFLTALKTANYKDTYQHYQPGVTIMWIDSIVNQANFKYQLTKTDSPKTLENSDHYPVVHGISKSVVVFILASLLAVQMVFIRKLFGTKIALIYGFLMAVEPYLVGIDRWFHQTSLETYFSFTSLILLLNWYVHGGKRETSIKQRFNGPKVSLILSAIFLAFSILAKLTTFIVGPLYLFIFISKFLKKRDYSIVVFALVFLSTITLFFPALWVDPIYVLSKLYTAAFGAVTNNIRAEIIPTAIAPIYYLLILIMKLSPITVVILFFAKRLYKLPTRKLLGIIALNLFIYYILLTIAEQKIDRYSIAMFPSIILLTASIISTFSNRLQAFVLSLSLVFFAIVCYIHYPIYSGYYSPFFFGTKGALSSKLYDNSGEYYSQAAQYMNNKSRDTITFVPFNYEAFSYFYNGNLARGYSDDVNYIVTSVNHKNDVLQYSNCQKIEKTFGSKELDIVYIYKCNHFTN